MNPAEEEIDPEEHDGEAAAAAQEEAPLTPLEKLGYILLMICEQDALPDDVPEESSRQERPPRALVLAALDKLWKEAEAEATDIALNGMISAMQRALRRRSSSKPSDRPKLSDLPEYLTVDDVCRYLGQSKPTVYAAVHGGQIPHVRFAGRQIRIPRTHFEQAVAPQRDEGVVAEEAKP
jgi:excisionase family DNA binding protein